MSAGAPRRAIPEETLRKQAVASYPGHSVWVSAHAGSGKTHVLSQRVIRLLLRGADPARILCLTYTRAAAANMSKRVFEDLARWTELSDADLSERIARMEGAAPKASDLERARTLFALALETPGGLKVQTIHAFCESILHQFPLEANIAAHFQMLDTRMEAALVAEARRDMISGVAGGGDKKLSEAFATVLDRAGEFGLDALLGEIVAKRDRLRAFIDAADDGSRQFVSLFDEMGVDPAVSEEEIAGQVWPLPGFPPDIFDRFVAIAQQENAANVNKWILPAAIAGFNESDAVARLRLLARGFLNGNGGAYATERTFGKIAKFMPDVVERYLDATRALISAIERIATLRMVADTRAALVVADFLIARYEVLKASRGFLDFNDLITRTGRLLGRVDAGAWVQYKLDQGIDHILIDEAQDTSPEQWAVVHALSGEFFAGAGARGEINRTVFAVGDEKQSIYSFQGASPGAFSDNRIRFSVSARNAGKPFETVELKQSFRSTSDVLRAVDCIFDNDATRQGVAADRFTHDTIRTGDPGYVELWPYVGAETAGDPSDWREGVSHTDAPTVVVAEHVARTIKSWLDAEEVLEGTKKRLRPGDIMVLVRSRDRFVHALSRSLKELQIDVAGADRLLLASHIAIKDLMSLGRVLLLPEDDLSLAALLKSPLVGLGEEALFQLAAHRGKGVSLFSRLREAAQDDPLLTEIVAKLDDWASEAAFRPPFEFFARVLGRDGGRKRFIARLGHEAGEILDEFLSFCLAEEAVGMPGLEDLLTTLETAGPEVKREMDQGRNEVRILTVHASKGLEAPVVFLVDAGGPPDSDAHMPRLIPFKPKSDLLHGVEAYLWRSSKDVANQSSRAIERDIKKRADEEYRRLLYVGLTRARDRLVLCGYYNIREPRETNWLSICQAALGAAGTVETLPHPAGTGAEVLRFRVTPPRTQASPDVLETKAQEPPKTPQELITPLPPQQHLPRPLTPSGAALLIDGGDQPATTRHSPVLENGVGDASALERGKLVHKLLQMLPQIPLAEREAAAVRYLERAASDWTPRMRGEALASVSRLLSDPQFAPVFAAGSAAEVAIVGTLDVKGRPRIVSGVIDRMAVAPDRVLIVDFKTNRPPPKSLAEVPQAYILQLALYAEKVA